MSQPQNGTKTPKTANPKAKPAAPKKKGAPPKAPPAKVGKSRIEKRISALERREDGPKVADQFTCTVNLGVVNSASSPDFTRSMQCFLSPLLLKDVNENSAAASPLSTRASQYSMYRLAHLRVDVLPLVGASGVGGTSGLLSLQLDSSQGAPVNYDSVATRPHVVLLPGQRATFKPKAPVGTGFKGGWYYTNTAANDGAASLGPSLEVYLLGTTKNIYTNSDFDGPLFRLSAHATYQFANYTPNPGLAVLQTDVQEANAQVSTNDKGEIIMSFDTPLLGGTFHTTRTGIGDAIFSVLDTVGGLASQVPVLGPLLDTGLAFLKPIFKTQSGFASEPTHDYLVCGSFDQAKAGSPLTTGKEIEGSVPVTLQCQQLTPMADGATVNPVAPTAEVVLPHEHFQMSPVSGARFSWAMPWYGQVDISSAPAQVPSLVLAQSIKTTVYANAAQHITTNYIGLRDYYATKTASAGALQDKLVKFMINPSSFSGGPSTGAVLRHSGDTLPGYMNFLGQPTDLVKQADLVQSGKTSDGWTEGWLTVASCPDWYKVPVGTRLLPVHYNIWQPTLEQASGNATQVPRQARIGWLLVEPDGTAYVQGFYGGAATSLSGVGHFFVVCDSRDLGGYNPKTRINTSPATERCLQDSLPEYNHSSSLSTFVDEPVSTSQSSRWLADW